MPTEQAIKDEIEARINAVRQQADAQRAVLSEIEAFQKWQKVPAQPSDSQLIAAMLFINSQPSASQLIDPDIMKDLETVMADIAKKDQPRMMQIFNIVQEKLQNPGLQPGLMIETAAVAPGPQEVNWALACFPLVIDQDLNVTMPQTLDVDLCLAAYVTPRESGLRDQFNIRAHYCAAGEKITPFVIDYTGAEQGVKNLHITGHLAKDNQVQPLYMLRRFGAPDTPAAPFEPKGPQV